jgi:hypothetical protein
VKRLWFGWAQLEYTLFVLLLNRWEGWEDCLFVLSYGKADSFVLVYIPYIAYCNQIDHFLIDHGSLARLSFSCDTEVLVEMEGAYWLSGREM